MRAPFCLRSILTTRYSLLATRYYSPAINTTITLLLEAMYVLTIETSRAMLSGHLYTSLI